MYDIETTDPNLPTYISDRTTHGSSIENRIEKEITWTSGEASTKGLESGKKYQILLHLGMNSVKFEAAVSDWNSTLGEGKAWVPSNGETTPNPAKRR